MTFLTLARPSHFLACLLLALSASPAWAGCTSGLPATTPTNRFVVDSSDQSVVLDRKTGLRWQRCPLGMSYSAGSCTGSATTYTFDQAQAAAVAAGGGWRVPNVKELASIVERRCTSPAINTAVFPNTPSNGFWTASPYVGDSDYAWVVDFNGGYVGYYSRSGYVRVRLVRASQ